MRRFLCHRMFPLAVLVAASLWVVSPTLSRIDSVLPIRTSQLATVPMFNAWTIWWNADRAGHSLTGYWDAPIFFPEQDTFAFSEPQPATLIVAPIIWITRSPAAAYNVYLLLSLTLNAVVTYLILRRHGTSRVIATLGGVMMTWLPVSLRQIEVLQLVPVWPLMWAWDAVRRHGRSPTWRTGVESAAAYAVSFWTCIHHTLFFSVVLAGTAWILFSAFRQKRFWTTSMLALSVASLLAGVVLVPMQQALSGRKFERSRELVARLSAQPGDLFAPPEDALLTGTRRSGFGLSAGLLKMGLAAMGLGLGLWRRKRRRWTLFLVFTLLSSALLSLGPNLQIGTWQPWWTLAEWCPGMSQVRNAFRFAYLTQMATILLAVTALSELRLRLSVCCRRPAWGRIFVTVVGFMAVAEVPAPRPLLGGVPDLNRHRGWTQFVRHNTPTGFGVACLPFSPGTRAADFTVTTRWMYYGTLHGVPLLNGYSGFFPESYMSLRTQVAENGLTDETLRQLADQNAHFLVVRRDDSVTIPFDGRPSQFTLRLVFSDEIGIDVYELVTETDE